MLLPACRLRSFVLVAAAHRTAEGLCHCQSWTFIDRSQYPSVYAPDRTGLLSPYKPLPKIVWFNMWPVGCMHLPRSVLACSWAGMQFSFLISMPVPLDTCKGAAVHLHAHQMEWCGARQRFFSLEWCSRKFEKLCCTHLHLHPEPAKSPANIIMSPPITSWPS